MNTETEISALALVVQALAEGDAAAAAAGFADDGQVVLRRAEGDLRLVGRSSLAAAAGDLLAGFSDLAYTPTRRRIDGAQVSEEGTVTARHTGAILGVPATGAPVCIKVWLTAHTGDRGLLRELSVQPDLATLGVQLGLPASSGTAAYAAIAEIRARNLEDLRVSESAPPPADPPVDPLTEGPAGPPVGPTSGASSAWGRRRLWLAEGAALAVVVAVVGVLLTHRHSTGGTARLAAPAAAAVPAASAAVPASHPDAGQLPSIAAPPNAKPTVQAGQQLVLGADVLFAFDSATLTPAASSEIARLAARITASHVTGTIQVNGYTDDVGTAAYALLLSRQRALAVAQALQPALAGQSVRLEPQGFGAADPVAPNSTEPGRARNRRVTIVLPQRP